jgi:hypothetical protein
MNRALDTRILERKDRIRIRVQNFAFKKKVVNGFKKYSFSINE